MFYRVNSKLAFAAGTYENKILAAEAKRQADETERQRQEEWKRKTDEAERQRQAEQARQESERRARLEAEARQQRAAAERIQAAQQARLEKIESFKRKARVETWIEPSQLGSFTSNPYPWKGKMVGFSAEFGVMRSENSALFSLGGTNFVVISNLSATRFTRSGQLALIAGRVQGITQATLPILGAVPVPEITLSLAEDFPQ
jgi:hypothetical protein